MVSSKHTDHHIKNLTHVGQKTLRFDSGNIMVLSGIDLTQCHEMTFNSNLLSRENPLEV